MSTVQEREAAVTLATEIPNGMIHIMWAADTPQAICGIIPPIVRRRFTLTGDEAIERLGKRARQGGICPACERVLADFWGPEEDA